MHGRMDGVTQPYMLKPNVIGLAPLQSCQVVQAKRVPAPDIGWLSSEWAMSHSAVQQLDHTVQWRLLQT